MSELPSGWVEAPMGDLLIDIEAGRSFRCSARPAAVDEWGVIKVSAMTWREFDEGENKAVLDDAQVDPRFEIRPGDVLFSRANTVNHVGAVVQVRDTRPKLLLSDKSLRLVSRQGVYPRWLLYYLRSPRARRYLESLATGTSDSMRNISQASLRGLAVPLAPLREQERVVEAIEAAFALIDAGVAGLELVRRRLKSMRAAVHEAAIREDQWMARQVEVSADEPPPVGEWRSVSVGDVAEVSGGITKNPERTPKSNPIPFLRVANVQRDGLDLAEIHQVEVFGGELERLRLKVNDLLVVEGNGSPDQIGRSALWNGSIDPCVHQNHLIRVRARDQILPEYLNIFWNSPSGMRKVQAVASSTSGLHTLSTGKVRSVRLPLPPISTQHKLVATVGDQLSWIARMEGTLEPLFRHAQVLRLSILKAAFNGSLVPQDPTDEPASVLLDRMTADRPAPKGCEGARHTGKTRTVAQRALA